MSINSAHSSDIPKLTYQSLTGKKNWKKLHPDIQRRFGEDVCRSVTYKGVMQQVRSSTAGKILAQFCRLIGTPLALYSGSDVPVYVNVYPNQQLNGMTWDRFYLFNNHPINRVKSTKCLREGTGLVEMVGYGFGMELLVTEKNTAIEFESTRFFWQFRGLKITIPNILSPGKTKVSQRVLDGGKFEFCLTVVHRFFGEVFFQRGIFEVFR